MASIGALALWHNFGIMRTRTYLTLWPALFIGVVLAMVLLNCSSLDPLEVGKRDDSGYPIKPTTSLVNEGRPIYQANCGSCHGDARNPPPLPAAPAHTADGHTWHHNDSQLVSWVLDGVPNGQIMPRFRGTLSESEVQATIAYIKTFWPDEVVQMQARGMH